MQSSFLHRFFWGIVVIAIGVVFLLNQTGRHRSISASYSPYIGR
ncbi:LiaI-LiaF-like domain-containing protein [Cohnella faecalis]|nr:DUF5668 domain-containing protein [Cohnella faecalis]